MGILRGLSRVQWGAEQDQGPEGETGPRESGHSPGTVSLQVTDSTAISPHAQDIESRASRSWKRKRPQDPQPGQRLLDVHQAGVFLGVSPWTARNLIWRGDLPHVKVGRLIRVDLRDLEAYITKNREQHPA